MEHAILAVMLDDDAAATRREVSANRRDLLTRSPQQQYLQWMREKPYLLELVPKKDLASMLGITPESFSRMLRRLRETPI